MMLFVFLYLGVGILWLIEEYLIDTMNHKESMIHYFKDHWKFSLCVVFLWAPMLVIILTGSVYMWLINFNKENK